MRFHLKTGLVAAVSAFLLAAIPAAAQSESGTTAEVNMQSFVAAWAKSAHADATAEAFTHWNDEGEIPARCAMCHAGTGFRDFYGIDGSAPMSVDAAAPLGGVIDCETCHSEGVAAITQVTFPSGAVITPMEGTATCMTCHQGRQSGTGLAGILQGMDDDTPNAELGFVNPHYKAAAATLLGSEVAGLYEYPGQTYVGRFGHVPAAASCIGCHSPHTLEVKVETCATCHADAETPRDIRINRVDFDGDGTGLTGLYHEVSALKARLKGLVLDYGSEVAGTPVIYAENYPYFFIDTDADGEVDEGEAAYPNAYKSWTPRMLRGAYNYQFVAKDPGSYAHNPRYALQALHDSIVDLSAALGRDTSDLTRAE